MAKGRFPEIGLSWSDDEGHNWSNARRASIGAQGEHSTRVVFRRLPRSRARQLRTVITDPVKVVILGATADITPGLE